MSYCRKCGQKTECGRPYCQHCINTNPDIKIKRMRRAKLRHKSSLGTTTAIP